MATVAASFFYAAIAIVPASAQCPCCTPYTYLQFCCHGCLVIDFGSIAKDTAQAREIGQDLVQLSVQAKNFAEQLANDYTILMQIGKTPPTVASLIHTFEYSQGLTFLAGNNVAGTASALATMYNWDQRSTNLGTTPPGQYRAMSDDTIAYSAQAMSYGAHAMQFNTNNRTDLANLGQQVASSSNKRMDLMTNSRIRAKLVDLLQTKTMLMGQYLALISRPIAAANQTDLSPMTKPANP